MKIIQVIPAFHLAGAETMCCNLSIALKQLGHDVTCVSLYTEESALTRRLDAAGVPLVYLGKRRGLDVSLYPKLLRLLQQTRPEVVHTHTYASRYALPAAVACRIHRIVHTVHNMAPQEQILAGQRLNHVLFRYFGVTPVALSPLVQTSIEELYGIPHTTIPLVYNGIDLCRCLPKPGYFPGSPFQILHIGRFEPQKNHEMLLQAFHQFHARYPDSRLQLIGDGPLRPRMEAWVNRHQLSSAVTFLGIQDNVFPYLQDADIFTLPSVYEGLPMVLIEAMGTGLPIVATAVGGVPDLLHEGENALLVPLDGAALYRAFERYYLDMALRQVHGQKALQRAQDFSASVMAQEYIHVYQHK